MKRTAFAALFTAFTLFLTGCAGVTVTRMPVQPSGRITPASFLFDQNQLYRGFSALPADYTPEKAVSDGCFVIVQGAESKDASLFGGGERWKEFEAASEAGLDASLRAVYFQNDTVSYFDLYYIKGKYRAFDSESDDLHDRPYSLLRRLTGTDGNPPRESALFVLTDSNDLTFEDVLPSFHSGEASDTADASFQRLWFTAFLPRS